MHAIYSGASRLFRNGKISILIWSWMGKRAFIHRAGKKVLIICIVSNFIDEKKPKNEQVFGPEFESKFMLNL